MQPEKFSILNARTADLHEESIRSTDAADEAVGFWGVPLLKSNGNAWESKMGAGRAEKCHIASKQR